MSEGYEQSASEQTEDTYDDTPRGLQKRYQMELSAAKNDVKRFHKQAKRAMKAYLAEKEDEASENPDAIKLPLFSSNIDTVSAILYGQTPKSTVSRKWGDQQDSLARIAGEVLERHLNEDIETDADGGGQAFRHALDDWRKAGLGTARLRYVVETEEQQATGETGEPIEDESGPVMQEVKVSECVEVRHIGWRDQLWSPCRTYGEARWWAFKEPMTKKQGLKRFGKSFKGVPLKHKDSSLSEQQKNEDPWAKADVWEIWDKEFKRVVWIVEGHTQALDVKDDPLCLDDFWPFPRPMFGAMNSDRLMPKPEYEFARHLYVKCNNLFCRIADLEESIGVKGLCDAANADVVQQLIETRGNIVLPVAGWALFGEKGGLGGAVQWLPLDEIIAAIEKLTAKLNDTIQLLLQVTGMSDVFRGQQQENGTPGEAQVKAKFASTRIQALQDEFARFVSDAQRLKAEIICKHFDDKTIIECSNIMNTPDAAMAQQAVQLLREKFSTYRVEVKPESVSMADFGQIKAESLETLGAIGQFFTQFAPIIQMVGPTAVPLGLELAQCLMAKTKGGASMEGIFDRYIAQAEQMLKQQQMQPQQAQQPDPKLIANQQKAQADMAKIQATTQSELVRMNAETQALAQRKMTDATINVKEAQAKKALDGGGISPMPGGVPV